MGRREERGDLVANWVDRVDEKDGERIGWRTAKDSRPRKREVLDLGEQLADSSGTPLQYSCLENPMDGGAW